MVLGVGGVALCRLSYTGRFGGLGGNEIGDDGAGAVAAAAGTMPCLETLEWVLDPFPLNSISLFPLFHINRFLSLKGTSWRADGDRWTQASEPHSTRKWDQHGRPFVALGLET